MDSVHGPELAPPSKPRLPATRHLPTLRCGRIIAICPLSGQKGSLARKSRTPDGKYVTPRKVVAMQEVMRQGLYDPQNEHDACGVGFVVNIKGRKSHDIIAQGLKILENLDHRGAVGADPLVGDGAGILIQMPDALLNDWARVHGKSLPAAGRYAVAMCFLPRDADARGSTSSSISSSSWPRKASPWSAGAMCRPT